MVGRSEERGNFSARSPRKFAARSRERHARRVRSPE
jgi:hypothetical protein